MPIDAVDISRTTVYVICKHGSPIQETGQGAENRLEEGPTEPIEENANGQEKQIPNNSEALTANVEETLKASS